MGNLSTSTRIINEKRSSIVIRTPEDQIADGEAEHDGDEDPSVEGHDGQHEHVPDGGVDPEEDSPGDPGRRPLAPSSKDLPLQKRRLDLGGRLRGRDDLEADAPILEVLVEGGDDEAGEQGEGVTGPRRGLP